MVPIFEADPNSIAQKVQHLVVYYRFVNRKLLPGEMVFNQIRNQLLVFHNRILLFV